MIKTRGKKFLPTVAAHGSCTATTVHFDLLSFQADVVGILFYKSKLHFELIYMDIGSTDALNQIPQPSIQVRYATQSHPTTCEGELEHASRHS